MSEKSKRWKNFYYSFCRYIISADVRIPLCKTTKEQQHSSSYQGVNVCNQVGNENQNRSLLATFKMSKEEPWILKENFLKTWSFAVQFILRICLFCRAEAETHG